MAAQPDITYIVARDGVRLAVHSLGAGRPVILLHGLFSSAHVNWIKYGHAGQLADAGFRVLMPDLRAHGSSDAPHDPIFYGHDVLARDAEDVIAHFGLSDFDVGGFSLGSRTSARAVVGGLAPRRLILAGMGLEGLAGWTQRGVFFRRAIAEFDTAKRGDDVWMAIQFMKTMKVDRVAADLLLQSFADTQPADLATITMPTLVLCGDQDRDNGSPDALADALPDARLAMIPGTHMSCIVQPALGQAMVEFLTAD